MDPGVVGGSMKKFVQVEKRVGFDMLYTKLFFVITHGTSNQPLLD